MPPPVVERARETHAANLTAFVKRLPQSHVKFVFFFADKMDSPRVITTCGKHKDWFLVPGQTRNYCYAYVRSDLVYVVTRMRLKQKDTVVLYTAEMSRVRPETDPKDVAYLGNHIDFSIQDTRGLTATTGSAVYYNSHWTEYFESADSPFTFERRAIDDCNFIAATKPFGKTVCVDRYNVPKHKLDYVFKDKKHQEIIEDLWKASEGKHVVVTRGGAPGSEVPPVGYKSYKGIHTLSPVFFEFMNRFIFSELWHKVVSEPLHVYQIFDEGNELDAIGGNKAIHYVVEFNEQRSIAFSVSSHRALKACWTNVNLDNASKRERRALSNWRSACSELLANDFTLLGTAPRTPFF
jgi:hypothetical protein